MESWGENEATVQAPRCLSPNTVFFKLKISPDLFDLEFDDCTRGPIHFSQRSLV